MSLKRLLTYSVLIFLSFSVTTLRAQNIPIPGGGRNTFRPGGNKSDSLQFEHRDPFADSVTIRFRYLDSARNYNLDSTLTDFYRKIPLKWDYAWLGNNGNAATSLLYRPYTQTGWDPGFHAFDLYAFRLDDTRFFYTTRPFTELNYLIGSGAEQFINLMQTQNIKPNWNIAFQFRLVNSPGYFFSQNTNHANLRLNSYYQGPSKRYGIYFVVMNNALQSAENGGIKSDTFLNNKNSAYNDRFNIPVNIGGSNTYSRDFFNTKLKTGNRYTNFKFLLRQQYDLGKKDSVVTDSSVIKLFYPRVRFEYTFLYSSSKFIFQDIAADSAFYMDNYDINVTPNDTLHYQDKWKEITNDFSIYQFPDIKNQQQFLRLGASVQNLTQKYDNVTNHYYNFFVHGEYRNRTKNRKWDVEANGQLYVNGFNAGDYSAYISLQRLLSRKLGYFELGFQNVNRTPSYLLTNATGFPIKYKVDLNKENITHLFAALLIPQEKLIMEGHYYLVGNFAYFKDFYEVDQQTALFNVLLLKLSKEFRLSRYWHWYVDAAFQKTAGAAPVNIPLFYTRNRFVFEGRFFKNLNLATGFDVRYNTPYTADNYSPIAGRFFPQDSVTISNRPDIAAFVHFRIRSFTGMVRVENLNTLSFENGFGFNQNNQGAPLYPYPGFQFKLGIFWVFAN
ncbi:MAG: hypothetical protein C5B52_19440 [Bacteroidetes bacterium]|nr:MAG: hypothetical protein C5B52_19440 [Bacteroidota bacterium]